MRWGEGGRTGRERGREGRGERKGKEGGRGLRKGERVVNNIKVDYNSSKIYIVVNFPIFVLCIRLDLTSLQNYITDMAQALGNSLGLKKRLHTG